MSLGCYLEFINRSFDKIEVKFDAVNKNDWEKKKMPNITIPLLTKTSYYYSHDLEMSSQGFKTKGQFRLTVTLEDGTPKTIDGIFDLEEGRSDNTCRIFDFSLSARGCIMLISKGINVSRVDFLSKDEGFLNNKGCYKFEFFCFSKRRFGVMNDYHFGATNIKMQTSVVNSLIRMQQRPEFIVMPGDLLNCPTPPHGNNNPLDWNDYREIWDNLIDPLEKQNMPVADGFGNHDLWTGAFAVNVKNKIKKRNEDRSKGLFQPFFYDQSCNKKKNDNKDYHYTWYIELQKNDKRILVAMYMLNNLPANSNQTDPGDDNSCHEEGTFVYNALDYMVDSMIKTSTMKHEGKDYDAIVGILFYHISFLMEKDRWWANKKQEEFACWLDMLSQRPDKSIIDTIKDPKCKQQLQTMYQKTSKMGQPIQGCVSFFGHNHISDICQETLSSPWLNDVQYTGFLCAASLYEPFLNVVDLSLTEINGEYSIEIATKCKKIDELGKSVDTNLSKKIILELRK